MVKENMITFTEVRPLLTSAEAIWEWSCLITLDLFDKVRVGSMI